jgi:2,4-dienoyl-CoA reductase-like NADH-dependent reductase (Old Yellow Enzyme family)
VPAYPLASSSLRVGAVELPNRIVRAAHTTGYIQGGIGEDFIAYHEARAAGCVALSILEIAAVHPSTETQGNELIQAYREEVVEQYGRLTERLHAHGTKVFQQLYHGGAYALWADGSPSWSASEIPGVRYGPAPIAMTKAMIDEVVEGYASAARHCKAGGVDGVELHAGHGYLLAQFLSLVTNRRADDYGGSAENRLRFCAEALTAVRREVGPGYPVGVRLSASDLTPGGPEEREMREFALELERRCLVDFVDVSVGTQRAPGKFIGAMHEPHGYMLPHAEQLTRVLSVPTIAGGRILTMAEAEEVLASGAGDLVSMVRATIADPQLVAKSFAGREPEVRPCIGCNQGCVGGLFATRRMGCAVNAEAGRETAIEPVARTARPKLVLVAGAGPAGLEAARMSALRGHRVVVHESADAPGGLTRFARLAPFRDEFGRISDWLALECARLGVELVYSSSVDAGLVRDMAPDVVVVATGSRVRRDGLQRWRPALIAPGLDLPHVVTPVEVLTGKATGRHAFVLDDLGSYAAVGVAEYLLRAGTTVTLAASSGTIASELVPTMQWEPAMARLDAAGATMLTRISLEAITSSAVSVRHLDSRRATELDCDLVVLVNGYIAERSLYDELVDVHPDVRLVGDARSPRGLQPAIAEANAAARALA